MIRWRGNRAWLRGKGRNFFGKGWTSSGRVGNGWDKVAMTIKVVDSCIIN